MVKRPRLKLLPPSVAASLNHFQSRQYERLIDARRLYEESQDRRDSFMMKRALAAERLARKWLRISGVSLREGRASIHRSHTHPGVIPPGTRVLTPSPIPGWRPDFRDVVWSPVEPGSVPTGESDHPQPPGPQETHSTACWDCGRLVRIEDTYSPKTKAADPFEQRPAYCQECFQKEETAGRARLVES